MMLGIVTNLSSFPFQGNLAHSATNDATPVAEFSRESALQDPSNRISTEFKVPAGLEKRTAFWFDIYTLYGSEENVIHHTVYPWIIYSVVDTRSLPESESNRWAKYHNSRRLIRSESNKIRMALRNLAAQKKNHKLTALENVLATKLESVPGKRSIVYRQAAQNVRVQLGQKDFFRSGLASSSRYLPSMEATFTQQGLPVELTRIPFVESSFNVTAESKVGASGIWQIMEVTGKSYLLVNKHIDERNSPLKASLAATRLIKFNYSLLENWPLTVTAYNHGAQGVKTALKKSKTHNLQDLIEKYNKGSFKFASANFYTSFLAVLHAEKYHSEIFANDPISYDAPLEHKIISLSKPLKVRDLLKKIGMNSDELIRYNFDLRHATKSNAQLPRGFRIIVPIASGEQTPQKRILSNPTYFKDAALTTKTKTSG